MFQVPMSAPTASRMNSAAMPEATPPIAASRTWATVWPFLNAIRPATDAARRSATCSGPAVASTPNVITVRAISAMSAISGMTASRRLGDRGPTGAPSSVPSVGRGSATSEARPQVGGHLPRGFMPGMTRLAPVEGDEADDRGGDHQGQDRTPQAHGSDPVPLDRAGHAVTATAALAELEPF